LEVKLHQTIITWVFVAASLVLWAGADALAAPNDKTSAGNGNRSASAKLVPKMKPTARVKSAPKAVSASRPKSNPKLKRVAKVKPAVKRETRRIAVAPAKPSFGELAGLHSAHDDLALRSSVALVIDQDTREILLQKNESAVLPIASITKLMTGVLVSEAKLPMDELITISQADVDTEKGSRSRLGVGTVLSRGELLHLALMASENRAAHALGRTYPGGLGVFVNLMNAKANALGMRATSYFEPTGLSSRNQSSATDLATLVGYAYGNATLRELSTSPAYEVEVGKRTLRYNNTNRLVKSPAWDIGLQKTGYISEAGQCLVMQAKVAGRKLIMVFLDSAGKFSRIGDAERVRRWVESNPSAVSPRGTPLAATTLEPQTQLN